MEFTIPTTKTEMFDTLREIYQHYHFRQLIYDGITLEELNINRLGFDELSSEEISNKARQLLSADHIREKRKASDEIDARLISLKEKLASSSATEEMLVKSAEENFDKAILSIKKAVYETGTSLTSSAQKKIKDAELKKVEEINKIRDTESKLREELSAEIVKEEERKRELDEYFITLHQAELQISQGQTSAIEKRLSKLTWEDLFALCDRKTKKMIICHLIHRVFVFRDYALCIELNFSICSDSVTM